MTNVGPEGRSFERILRGDLDRLAQIAQADRTEFFASHADWASLYRDRHFATALCQGAAMHYLEGKVGIQDFDVWSFFHVHPARHWYATRIKTADFGDPKFGTSLDKPHYVGRRVDLLGRGIDREVRDAPAEALLRWLHTGKSESARLLREKAIVMLDPPEQRGQVIWRNQSSSPAA